MSEASDYEKRQMLWYSANDKRLFDLWTKGLSKRPENWPYGSGPYSVGPMRQIMEVHPPSNMLEIGFNLGQSAAIWLGLGVGTLVSVDVNAASIVRDSGNALERRHRNFKLLLVPPEKRDAGIVALYRKYDTAFIDGDHSLEGVRADIALCLKLGIKHLIFDDYYPYWGPGVQPAIEEAKLKIHGIFGGKALCEDVGSDWEKP